MLNFTVCIWDRVVAQWIVVIPWLTFFVPAIEQVKIINKGYTENLYPWLQFHNVLQVQAGDLSTRSVHYPRSSIRPLSKKEVIILLTRCCAFFKKKKNGPNDNYLL